jgi:CheY-like chemotaxis protein
MSDGLIAGRGTILVVDDEPVVRDIASVALSRRGFVVLAAASGEEALQYYSANAGSVSLILLDMNMPGLGGLEMLRHLRAAGAAVPVLVFSGFTESEVAERFEGLAIAGVIEKPFTPGRLADRVLELLP